MANAERKERLGALISEGTPPLIGFLYAIGLLLPSLSALGLSATGEALFTSLTVTIACWMLSRLKRGRWLWTLCIVGVAFFAMLMAGTLPRIGAMLGASVHVLSGNTAPMTVYGPEVALVFGAAITVFGFLMAKHAAGFYPALSLALILLLAIWYAGHVTLWMVLPALIALLWLFARMTGERMPDGRTLLCATLIVLCSLGIATAFMPRSLQAETFAENLRTWIADTFFFTDPRTVYTVEADGFQADPQQLGGPTEVNEHPVMTVTTPVKLWLRGSVQNEYTGLSWHDTLSIRRYLYQDPRNRAVRMDVLDEQRPSYDLQSNPLFDTVSVTVQMYTPSASTLFVSQRASQLIMPMAMVPYFNASSEMFITRDLAPGDTYSFETSTLSADDPRMKEMLHDASIGAVPRELAPYLKLPEQGIAPQLFALVETLVKELETPLEQALAIRDYLSKNFSYTLSPEMAPKNQDFVSYFVLRGKEGYCTYFASAMAVMGRIAGLPTRYVQGYLAEPVNGLSLVTSKNAHAWCEVYFEGFGWLTFDATPGLGGGGAPHDPPPDNPETPPEDEVDQQTEPSPSPQAPEQNPDVEPTPSSQPDEQPDPTPSPDDEPTDLPTPMPKKSQPWWLLLILFGVVLLAVLRERMTRPNLVIKRYQNPDDQVMLLYRTARSLCGYMGVAPRADETPNAHAKRLQRLLPDYPLLSPLSEVVTAMGYGRAKCNTGTVHETVQLVHALEHAMPTKKRLSWLFHRMVHGLGSVRQIP